MSSQGCRCCGKGICSGWAERASGVIAPEYVTEDSGVLVPLALVEERRLRDRFQIDGLLARVAELEQKKMEAGLAFPFSPVKSFNQLKAQHRAEYPYYPEGMFEVKGHS